MADRGIETVNFNGIKIEIENPIGSIREGKDEKGRPWKTKFFYPYGYICGVEGTDGDSLDCFIGPNNTSNKVFIMHQLKIDGTFDEHKVLLGFDSLQSARDAYLAHYSTQGFIGHIDEMPLFEFKSRIKDLIRRRNGKSI
jgi:hypothetical protein